MEQENSIHIAVVPAKLLTSIDECENLLNRPKSIKISECCKETCTVVISNVFKLNEKYTEVFQNVIKSKHFSFKLSGCDDKDDILLEILWNTAKIQSKRNTASVIEFFYNEQIIENKEKTPMWRDKGFNAQNPSVIYEYLKKYHSEETLSENVVLSAQHKRLRPTLRKYQSAAVRWMIDRELNEDSKDILNPLYIPLKTPQGLVIYYSENLQCLLIEKPLVQAFPKGGILADEMGLGKTVEILSLILMNPRKVFNWSTHFDQKEYVQTPLALNKNQDSRNQKPPSYRSHYLFTKLLKNSKKLPGKTTNDYLKIIYKKHEKKFKELESENSSNGKSLQCVCGKDSWNKEVVQCITCDKMQHFDCIYKSDPSTSADDVHICPSCWVYEQKIISGATLIISPLALSTQWESEIKRHIKKKNLKLFMYEGVRKGWVSPMTLANYDIVLTTYTVLQKEFYHSTDSKEMTSRSGRYSKRYDNLTSPLMFIQWWRICLDEGQMVDCALTIVSQMVKCLTSVNRWAVTGTPIQKTVEDLYGLINFLGMEPYNDQYAWSWLLFVPYALGNPKPLLDVLGKIMWRTEKKDVLDQVNIPPQEFKENWLDLSEIESFYYKLAHEDKSDLFLEKLQRYDLDRTLGSFDIKTMNSILQPLLSLRQDCTQPYIGGMIHGSQSKQILSMNDLLNHLISSEKLKVEEALRQTISDMNGLAGLYLLEDDIRNAKITYEAVLKLSESYKKDFHIDSLLKIHTLNSLYEVSRSNLDPNTIVPAEITSFKQEATELEIRYLKLHYEQMIEAKTEHETSKTEIDNIYEKFEKPINHWWQKVIEWSSNNNYDGKLIQRIDSDLNNVFGVTAIDEYKWESTSRFNHNLKTWCAEITDAHRNCLNLVKQINISCLKDASNISIDEFINKKVFNDMTQESALCHLRKKDDEVKRKNKIEKKCLLCKLKSAITELELTLFCIQLKTANWYLNNVRTEGSWKPRAEELVVKSLLSLARTKFLNEDLFVINDGELHQNLIDAYKTDFKNLRKFWMKLSYLIDANDELEICKIRMELDLDDVTNKPQPSKIAKLLSNEVENRLENLNMFKKHQIPVQKARLERERQMHLQAVQRLSKSWSYLTGLRNNYKDMTHNNELCPVCMEVLGKQWAMFTCGHSFCISCTSNLCQDSLANISMNVSITSPEALLLQRRNQKIKCCVCRQQQEVQSIHYVTLKNDPSAENAKEINIVGNYSTKIQAVLKLILTLREQDESVKILIFSQWTIILQFVGSALEKNSIRYKLHNSNNPTSITQFKDPTANITCLLLPLRFGSKGLNLTEATHIILMEPLMNPGEEIQAVNRVHRIGQTKKTYVHRFIVRNTIEQQIYNAMKNKWNQQSLRLLKTDEDDADDEEMVEEFNDGIDKDHKHLTLAQLADLFLNANDTFASGSNEN